MVTKKAGGGSGRKETTDKMSTLASKAIRGESLTKSQIKSLGGSVLGQDEHKGKRK
jgi:hypothetical protein